MPGSMVIAGGSTAGFRAMVKVILVDDQDLVRKGLVRILNQEEDFRVVAECEDGDQVIAAVSTHQPDLILMDVRMKRLDGISATQLIRAQKNPPPISMLTTFGDEDVLWNALVAGAAGFILKDAPAEEMVRASRVVANGGAWLDPRVTGHVIKHYRTTIPLNKSDSEIDSLTQREREVLVLIARGLVNSEIAARLSVSEATVKTHISRIFDKLGTRDRAAAIIHAYDHGIAVPKR